MCKDCWLHLKSAPAVHDSTQRIVEYYFETSDATFPPYELVDCMMFVAKNINKMIS